MVTALNRRNGSSGPDTSRVMDRSSVVEARTVQVTLSGEQLAAVEGWRAANRIGTHSEALSELVTLGLLSEISSVYRMVLRSRHGDGDLHQNGSEASA